MAGAVRWRGQLVTVAITRQLPSSSLRREIAMRTLDDGAHGITNLRIVLAP